MTNSYTVTNTVALPRAIDFKDVDMWMDGNILSLNVNGEMLVYDNNKQDWRIKDRELILERMLRIYLC